MVADRRPPRTWTVGELLDSDMKLPPPLLGEGMLVPGNISLMAGAPGAGKTYLAIALADAIASGEPFGKLPTRPGRVLFLSEEMREVEMKKRAESYAWKHWDGIRWVFRPNLGLHAYDGSRYLRRIVSESPADLIVLDHLRAAHSAAESNDALAPILKSLLQVADEFSAAFCVLHHTRKPLPGTSGGADDIRGGTILRAEAADVFLVRQNDTERVLEFSKTRYQPEPDPMKFLIGWQDDKVDILWQT